MPDSLPAADAAISDLTPTATPDLKHPAAPWIALTLLPGFGLRYRHAASEALDSLTDLLRLGPATLSAMGLAPETRDGVLAWQAGRRDDPVVAGVLRILADCDRLGVALCTPADTAYPDPLRHIHDAPLVLYLQGEASLLARPQIGIIGSRNATAAGLDHARRFAAELAGRRLVVTSGLALGVDGAAHTGALDANGGTVAVIGCGPDRVYPHQHRRLRDRILEQGLVVSEYPPGTPPRAGHFPKRNRILSGLSLGILVVEAGLKSGSLITARLALEQGREIFAIPGSIHNPVARGCHALLRQGACLVETVGDVLAELDGAWAESEAPDDLSQISRGPDLSGLAAREIAVLEALGYDPVSTDTLGSATGLSADALMQSLLLLELEGLAASVPGGYLRLA